MADERATFYCKTTFAIPEWKLFVFAGSIMSGVVKVGMLLHIPLNQAVALTVEISGVEFISTDDPKSKTGLTTVCDETDEIEFLKACDIHEEELEITAAAAKT
jgi:hypothetical protein